MEASLKDMESEMAQISHSPTHPPSLPPSLPLTGGAAEGPQEVGGLPEEHGE